MEAALAVHKEMRKAEVVREADILGCALQSLRDRSGQFAAALLNSIDLSKDSRHKLIVLSDDHVHSIRELMIHLDGTNARRAPGQSRKELWASYRAVVVAALYNYGLECQAYLARQHQTAQKH